MKRLTPSVFFAALMLVAPTAYAGSFAVTFDGGLRTMSNSPDTEKAIFGSSPGIGGGLGISYDPTDRWRFGVDVRLVSREGERAFAVDRASEAFRLGHPLELTLTQGLASASFRFGNLGPVSPYLSVGAGFASWKEESRIAGLTEQASGTAALFEGRLGIEREQGRIRLGLEGGITMIPNAVGVGGISRVYEEKDLGGLFVVLKLGFTTR